MWWCDVMILCYDVCKPITEHHLRPKFKICLIDISQQAKVLKTNRDIEVSIFMEIGCFPKKGWYVQIYDTLGLDSHAFLIFPKRHVSFFLSIVGKVEASILDWKLSNL